MTFTADSAVQASACDLDKPIVPEVAGAEAAGLYAAAFRILETLGMPMRALAPASYALNVPPRRRGPRALRRPCEPPHACGSGHGGAGCLALMLPAGLLQLVVRLTAVFRASPASTGSGRTR